MFDVNIKNFYLAFDSVKRTKPSLVLTISFNQFKIKGNFMAISLVPEQTLDVQINAYDRKGRLVNVDNVSFDSSDESVFTVEQNATNPLKAVIKSVGVGVAQLDYTVDADLDDDEVRELSDFVAVEVKSEEATTLGFTVGTPVDIEPVVTLPVEPVEPTEPVI